MTPNEREKLEVLNGDRGNKQDSALRLKHAQALLAGLPVDPTGNAATDIRALYAALNALRIVLR